MPTSIETRQAVLSRIQDIRIMLELDGAKPAIQERETCTRYAVIDPILWSLGWETWNPREVHVERKIKVGRVDYALLGQDGNPVILIEAKTWGKDVVKWERQLSKYARGLGEGVACITDGWEWLIYNLSLRGRFAKKRVASVYIMDGEGKRAASSLNKWLRKARWR